MSGEGGNTHLWEESWDDDDTSEDFSKQLKFVTMIFRHLEPRLEKLIPFLGRN